MWTVVTDMCTIANIAWKWMSLGTTSSTGCCAHEGVFRSRRSAQRAKNGCALRTRCPQKWRAGARPGGLSFFLSSLPLFLFSLSLFPYLPPPFLGAGRWKGEYHSSCRSVALGNALSSMSVEGGCVCSLLFLSVSLSLFFFKVGRDDVTLGFGTVAAAMWVATTSPPPRLLVSLCVTRSLRCLSLSSLSLFLSLCLSFFLYFPLFSLKAERDDDTPGFARLRR